MTYPTPPNRTSDPAVTRGVIVLIVAALIGIILLAGSGSFTAKNASTKKATTTISNSGSVTTTATTTTPPAPTTHPPAEVKVLVLNGTGGQLATAGADNTKKLTPAGYATLPPNDAATAAQSHVYFTVGYELDARAIAKVLGLPDTSVAAMPTPLPSLDSAPANVVALIGADQGGKATTGGATTGGTTTGGTTGTTTGGATTGTTGSTTTGGTTTGGTSTGGATTGRTSTGATTG